jgi:RimJ/RimL family protein N-acetyltransferase
MSAPTLVTERLTLRAPTYADAPRLAELANDFGVTRMTTRMPHPYTLEDARTFVARVEVGDPAREVTWVVADGTGPVGVIGFYSDRSFTAEVGYWLGRPAWGRGYASETLARALAWADNVWRRRCLVACCYTDNPASARVLEKSGFLPTGVRALSPSLARGGEAMAQEFVRIP